MSGTRMIVGVAAVALAAINAAVFLTTRGGGDESPALGTTAATGPDSASNSATVAPDLVPAGVDSFTVTAVTRWLQREPEQTLQFTREQTTFYRRPGNWHLETISTTRNGEQVEQVYARSSGNDGWTWRPGDGLMTRGAGSPGGFIRPVAPYEFGSPSLEYVVEQLRPCYVVSQPVEDSVAGRPAYRFDLEPRCPDAPGTRYHGPRTIWLDRETLFVLRERIVDRADGTEVYFREVTDVRYSVALEDELFEPPPGMVGATGK